MTYLNQKVLFAVIAFLFITSTSINNLEIIRHSQPSVEVASNSMELIDAINSLRISNGLPVYQVNQILMYVAQNHTDYQASIGTVTHYGPDGSSPFQRALAAGYLVAGDLTRGGYFSENITAGRNYTVADAVNSWQLDGSHVNTMLSPTLREIGAGVSVVGDYIYYTIDVGLSSSNPQPIPQGNGIVPTQVPLVPGFVRKLLTNTPEVDGSIIHVVQLGDTIWSIAHEYKVTEDEIIKLNSLKDNFIYVGDKLVIRSPFTPTPVIPTSTPTQLPSLTPISSPTINGSAIALDVTLQTSSNFESVNNNNTILISIIIFTVLISGLIALTGNKGTKN
ncbi:MAG: hypothetical protein A2X25_11035 [Chloroflexi bacterium GWB2_49_20]|nr:MAG: hypothetical protein A2X25_11035 [Chloroflexi bacterium GWB2_49_20]OGN78910.1 MAG: hypothetical protein A2X26_00320 [Chloroflexi bacterium GWC2_49_37]OGN86329.1 MAG: hypothetical protein A2X27_05460 [Chloroflexi bacterium GWD2_49_16]